MSFLNNVRLTFSGRFQADVSTVNNDVRHYDNSTFQPDYQKLQDSKTHVRNGWWNPTGSGAFRLLDCKIVGVGYADGTVASKGDAAIGQRICGPDGHSSAKLVDIDPQWQLASAPWGLDLRLTHGSGPDLVSGRYLPHAFRDLWFGRVPGLPNSDGGATATFQSVLEDVRWASDLKGSRALEELRQATEQARLSIRFMTFGFSGASSSPDFTLGYVVGTIGPYREHEPESFILGRRFAPANGQTSWNGCSYFSGLVDEDAKMLFLDLSNALLLQPPNTDPAKGPIVPFGTMKDIGKLSAGILKRKDVLEFTPADPSNFLPIGQIPYDEENWLLNTAGVVAFPLDGAQLALIKDHPLALAAFTDFNTGTGMNGEFGQIAIRETTDGLFVEAEPLVFRIDPPGSGEVSIYTAQFGAPLPGAEVRIGQLGKMPGQGGGGGPQQPPANIPDIGVPEAKFHAPASVRTDARGTAKFTFAAENPGNPRTYIDGQVYLIDFRLPNQGNQARSPFDYVVAHVREAVAVPADPTWTDVAPILTQYANLYPVMSRVLLKLSDPQAVKRHAKLLHLAFSLPIEDSNHMPVTRDLSAPKREMILRFLERLIAGSDPALEAAIAAAPHSSTRPAEAPPDQSVEGDSKTVAARNFSRLTGRPLA
jgi:hypothetical protein